MATKRAYKLQEFVAHASNVNCGRFGRRTSRILITGGEDRKVNLWTVGKPTALLSLSGTSPIESVSFDSSEVMIGAGAASGTIKMWDVEEAKVVRTFTGHRSNCASLDFHPFGEFLASGSSDTNMKIWDIRKKKCIHTYKGHTRRINMLKFTPDGRWIVSGGNDNSVKIWDLTAGKLLHDFSIHEGPVNCLDFHPHEFLLATGSADKTVKFWDLETFELIGSSGPENSREYFVPILSWEPIICHDIVDVGWSILADITVDEGKLLGCSYNQSCVGVWVVDLMRVGPYAVGSAGSELNENAIRPIQSDNSISSVFGRLSMSRRQDSEIAPDTLLDHSMSASIEIPVSTSSALTKRSSKSPGTRDLQLKRSDSVPLLSPRVRLNPTFVGNQKRRPSSGVPLPAPRVQKLDLSSNAGMLSHNSHASAAPIYRSRSNISASSKELSFAPVLFSRRNSRVDAGLILKEDANGELPVIEPRNIGGLAANHRQEDGKLVHMIGSDSLNMDVDVAYRRITSDLECKEVTAETSLRTTLDLQEYRKHPENQTVHERIFQLKPISSWRKFVREPSGPGYSNYTGSVCTESVESNEVGSWCSVSSFEKQNSAAARNPESANINRNTVFGLSQLMEPSEIHAVERPGTSSSTYGSIQYEPTLDSSRSHCSLARKQMASATDEDAMAVLMENHQEFIHIMKSRKTKLEVVYQCWQANDIKGFLDATWITLDHAVTADIITVLRENSNCIALDTCSSILRLASGLLESSYDRHLRIALEMVLGLVKSFGATISSTLSSALPVGVDLEAERRLERCNLCFQEFKKVSGILKSLTWRQGEVGISAQELSLFLKGILQLY